MAKSKTSQQNQNQVPADQKDPNDPTQVDTNKGYAGTSDHETGKVQSDPNQASPEEIKQKG